MRSFPPEELYYITHTNNLRSILEKGILSHERIEQLELEYTSIYDEEIVSNRKNKLTPSGNSLWYYANLYFQPRNSMLFRVVNDRQPNDRNIVVIGVSKKIMRGHGVLITDGNAANYPTQFYSFATGLEMLKHQWHIIQRESWNEGIGTKRKMMAECLVPVRVKPDFFCSLYVAHIGTRNQVMHIVGKRRISLIIERHMFFKHDIYDGR